MSGSVAALTNGPEQLRHGGVRPTTCAPGMLPVQRSRARAAPEAQAPGNGRSTAPLELLAEQERNAVIHWRKLLGVSAIR